MLVEFEKINFDDYQFIIAGSGPAGLSLALGLKKKTKKKVLLIEAGSFEFDNESQDHYQGILENNCGLKDLDVSRIRAFGGTSMVWGGMCRPLDNIDFKSWPINEKQLTPYLNDAYKFTLKIQNFWRIVFKNYPRLSSDELLSGIYHIVLEKN